MKQGGHDKTSFVQYTRDPRPLLKLYSEQWLMKRLQQHDIPMLDAGVTDMQQRRENVRAAIAKIGPEKILGRGKDDKQKTFADVFESLYEVTFEIKSSAV